MRFKLISGTTPLHIGDDSDLIPLAARHGPVARIWMTNTGLIVPRTYTRWPHFEDVCAAFAKNGWPITVRLSGGGVVPQGPGILNLSLAFPAQGRPMDHSEAAYLLICRIIQTALMTFGIETHAQAVEGSFCDGRFNLAVDEPARKVAGTAQVWRQIPAGPASAQVGLVHALILAHVNPDLLTEQANRLEAALGNPRRYLASRIASLDTLALANGAQDFSVQLYSALITALQADWVLHP
ncbi:lipoate--protein ligase family protein [Alcaligenaceae bacterium CGII-47]|nr:lipoate--protein ligase family protein [Alcaligenaceae bacterium CGII-47]